MTIKIDLPDAHVVTKGPRDKTWNASVSVDVTALSADIVARLAIHGLHQKVADAAAGATNADEANAAMQKAVDAIVAGDWTSRTAGAGVDERTRVERSVTMAAAKAKFGAKSPEWATFGGLSDDAKNEKLDAWYAAFAEVLAPEVEAEMARRAEKRASKTGLAAKVGFEL
jgi:hypothetical protein